MVKMSRKQAKQSKSKKHKKSVRGVVIVTEIEVVVPTVSIYTREGALLLALAARAVRLFFSENST